MKFIFLFVLGAAMGSFANAVAWRLHAGRNFITERSECDHCGHTLAPLDLVPILSWLLLRGRCRYCHVPLSWQHPLVEAGTGLLFVALYVWWPGGFQATSDSVSFGFWLAYLVGVVILFLYDLKWQLLPDKIIFPLIALAVLEVLISKFWLGGEGVSALVSAGAGVVAFAGFFGLLYGVSRGRWLGFGDVKLGVFMGLALGFTGSVVALLGSYYIAAAVVVPLLLMGKVNRKSHVPFGPFLLIAFILSHLFITVVTDWWQTLLG